MPEKGSVLPLLLLVALASAAVFLGSKYLNKPTSRPVLQIPRAVPQARVYTDKDLKFQFEYPSNGFEVVADNEETYFKATATDHRKNFSSYVGYQPPVFVKGLIMKKTGTKVESQYDDPAVILWVFDNSGKLTIDSWFDKYWYYPFIWGIFAYPGKGHIQPNKEVSISGHPAKSVAVSYQPGQPEFIYVENGDKMFMFRVIKQVEEKTISQVLSSFKFTK